MAVRTKFLLAFVICVMSIPGIRSEDSGQGVPGVVDYDFLIGQLANALDRVFDFFLKEADSLNLDAVIGARMAEGQLKNLLRRLHYKNNQEEQAHLPVRSTAELYETIRELHNKAHEASENALPYIAVINPNYFNELGELTADDIWDVDYRTRPTDWSLIYPKIENGNMFNEHVSDGCLNDIMRSGCNMSDSCWAVMTAPNYEKYHLTHEILYIMIGEQMKCERQMQYKVDQNGQTSTWFLKKQMCANVIKEMHDLSDKGLPTLLQDIFLEQAAICGMLGFKDVFSISWLKTVLSWQEKEGCFSNGMFSNVFTEMLGKLGWHARAKREEVVMEGGCLAHKSAVAVAAMAVYMRYLLEEQFVAIHGPVHLEN